MGWHVQVRQMAPPGNSWVDCPAQKEDFRFVKAQLQSGHVHQQVVKVSLLIYFPGVFLISLPLAPVVLGKDWKGDTSSGCIPMGLSHQGA